MLAAAATAAARAALALRWRHEALAIRPTCKQSSLRLSSAVDFQIYEVPEVADPWVPVVLRTKKQHDLPEKFLTSCVAEAGVALDKATPLPLTAFKKILKDLPVLPLPLDGEV